MERLWLPLEAALFVWVRVHVCSLFEFLLVCLFLLCDNQATLLTSNILKLSGFEATLLLEYGR